MWRSRSFGAASKVCPSVTFHSDSDPFPLFLFHRISIVLRPVLAGSFPLWRPELSPTPAKVCFDFLCSSGPLRVMMVHRCKDALLHMIQIGMYLRCLEWQTIFLRLERTSYPSTPIMGRAVLAQFLWKSDSTCSICYCILLERSLI